MSDEQREPGFITRDGLVRLKKRVDQLRKANRALSRDRAPTTLIEREHLMSQLADAEQRLNLAIPVDLPRHVPERVQFGVSVRLEAELDGVQLVTLVGEDEADPAQGRISWLSPLGRALNYREVGDVVTWQRGRLSVNARILAIELPPARSLKRGR